MLVLARGKNDSIIINDDIEITIVEIKSDQIKIGIQAPKNVKVHRKEVYDKIKLEMKKAAQSQLPNFDLPQKQQEKSTDDPSKDHPESSSQEQKNT